MPLTASAKSALSVTIRALRARMLADLHDAAGSSYRLAVLDADKAGLDEGHRIRRARLDAWLDERARSTKPKTKKDHEAARARFRVQAEKEAAATLLNRVVVLRLLEARGLSRPKVLTGAWNSLGYREFRDFAPTITQSDETGGMQFLLDVIFAELALDMPGLFGDVGLTKLFPVPPATLREVIERLDDAELESAWDDDTTLGWIYQYWNDPEREALDAKIKDGGKIEPHEIASKTQMFTERYMVEWLLQNSLGFTWLAMCREHGWTAEADTVLPVLDARRAVWRAKRDAGEVALDALMPIESELEERWKYFVPQPIPDDAVTKAPESVRAIKLLDPACGSGHFLVIAFDLLAAMYNEEARHRGETISAREIAESILENNLHGVDIDARAIQIAAAALVLKARTFAKDARPKRMNLVAPALNLAALPKDDPALVQLRHELLAEAGIPETLTEKIVASLAGVDHLGTLLKVDAAVDAAIGEQEKAARSLEAGQGDLFKGFRPQQVKLPIGETRVTVLEKIERFLARHSGLEDLGLRLDGEQLAAGVRFVRMVREGTYDVVVGNPPYQGTGKMADAGYVGKVYPRGKADLYAAFLERALELTREGGISALLTMRGWMFLAQFHQLREWVLAEHDLRTIGDIDRGGFEAILDEAVSVAMAIVRRGGRCLVGSVAVQPTPPTDHARDNGRTKRKLAALVTQVGRFEFQAAAFKEIEGEPIVYWWPREFLKRYVEAPKLGERYQSRKGAWTTDNVRFLRRPHEVVGPDFHERMLQERDVLSMNWLPYVGGARGEKWVDSLSDVIGWKRNGIELKVLLSWKHGVYPQGTDFFFRRGVAFSQIGSMCNARIHRYAGAFGDKGSSVFPPDQSIVDVACQINRKISQWIIQSLNPSISFQLGDVGRLPIHPVESADAIYATLDSAFSKHEAAREPSVEFRRPGSSAWTYTQLWAQRAVDRAPGEPLPPFEPVREQPVAEAYLSFAIGVALGRFDSGGGGALSHAPADALPGGILFVSGAREGDDSLDHPACSHLLTAWNEHGPAIAPGEDLRTYLRKSFFAYHKDLYENRPIYFPLSSAKKNFVAFVSIHRWTDDTLRTLVADHLQPERRALEGEIDDLRRARAAGDGSKNKAEKRYAEVQKLLEELTVFIDAVLACESQGPPDLDDKTKRERDHRYATDLDDGVMVNSAALWPLLEPQWKDPKKWWKELASAQGRKDYDWSHLAALYFPKRVAAKCAEDPSLAVAHKCFWRIHPAKAYAWELRLQDEIREGFTIDEPGSDEARETFLREHEGEAEQVREAERARRERQAKKAEIEDGEATLFETDDPESEAQGG